MLRQPRTARPTSARHWGNGRRNRVEIAVVGLALGAVLGLAPVPGPDVHATDTLRTGQISIQVDDATTGTSARRT